MNQSQVVGIIERVVVATLSWAVGRGYVGAEDASVLVGGMIAVATALWGLWNNRNKRLAERAAGIPGTTVVTSPVIAHSSPMLNVVSNTETTLTRDVVK